MSFCPSHTSVSSLTSKLCLTCRFSVTTYRLLSRATAYSAPYAIARSSVTRRISQKLLKVIIKQFSLYSYKPHPFRVKGQGHWERKSVFRAYFRHSKVDRFNQDQRSIRHRSSITSHQRKRVIFAISVCLSVCLALTFC